MAGGSILDMQDLGDGRYQAITPNGPGPVFTGDAGRQAFERLRKEESAVGPNALAKAPRQGKTEVGAPQGGQPEVAQDFAPNESKPRGVVPGGYAQDVAERPNVAPAPQQGQPAPQQPQGPTQLGYAAEGYDASGKKVVGPAILVNGQMMIQTQGSKGSKGGITPLGQQTLDEREAAAAKAKELEAKARQSEMQGVALAVDDVAKQQAYLKKREEEAVLAAKNAEQEAADADNYVLDLRARADKAVEEHAGSRMEEDSGAQKFFQGLGASIGAFGATLGKTPNFAAEFIQQLKNNKIRKWEAEVNIKGAKANNLLARLKDATGDMKLAKAAASVALDRQAAVEAQQMALSTKSDQIRNAWETAANASAANGVKSEQKLNEDARLAFMTNKMYNKPGVAGTPGGLVLATQGAFNTGQGISIDAKKALEAKNAAAGGGARSEKEKVYEQTAGAVLRKAKALVEQAGGSIDENGNIVGDKFDLPIDVPGGDGGAVAGYKAGFTELGSMYANMNNAGAEAGQPTKEALTPKLGTFSNAAAKAQLQAIVKGAYDAARAIDAQRQKAGGQ